MEYLTAVTSSIVRRIGELTVAPVCHQLGYLFHYKSNVDNLKTQLHQLKQAKERLQRSVDEAVRNLEEIEADVEEWIGGACETIEELEKFVQDEEQANTRCVSGSFPNLVLRYRLSKKAKKMTLEVVKVKEAGKFQQISYPLTLQSAFENKGYKTFETRMSTLTQIMGALEDPNVTMIGIYGMAGVGKTMLAREVAGKARGLFSIVVMVTISQTPDFEKIQQEIAEKLHIEIKETNLSSKADRVRLRLMQEEKILIILDDVWEKFDLQFVGIDFGDNQKGCKILLTSRFQDVLCDEMDTQTNFRVGVLSNVEAMQLFNSIVGDSTEKPDFQKLGADIVEECSGLPIAIATVAHALRNKSLFHWKDALTQLKRSSPTTIKGDNVNFVKMHDVIRDVGISIASKDHNMHNIRSNAELESCLNEKSLEDATAISLLYDGIDYIPEKLECSKLRLIWMWKMGSLQIPDQFFEETKLLKVLDLSRSCLKPLPSSFCFLQDLRALNLSRCKLGDAAIIGDLKALEILDVSGSDIKQLPKQMGQLTRLRSLDLHECYKLEVIQSNVMSKLTRLEELNMESTHNVKWQVEGGSDNGNNASLLELKALTQLKTLHIHIPHAYNLPKDLFSDKLEVFEISIGRDILKYHDFDVRFDRTALKLELRKSQLLEQHGLGVLLRKSEVLCLIGVEGVNCIIKELDTDGFPRLKHFDIEHNAGIQCLVSTTEQTRPCSVFRSLESLILRNLIKLESICCGKVTPDSFNKLRSIEVYHCDSLKNLFSFAVARYLVQLRRLEVADCKMMEKIVANDEQSSGDAVIFPQLSVLTLSFVPKLLQLWPELELSQTTISSITEELQPSATCFQNLRFLTVAGGCSLKHLFSSFMASKLRLFTLEVRDCNMMEEIVTTDQKMDKIQFWCLRTLKMKNLSNLRSFSTGTFIEFPILHTLEIEDCPELMNFISTTPASTEMLGVEKQKEMNSKGSNTMFSLFNDKVAFPRLTGMTIDNLDSLESIWQDQLIANSFGELEVMRVYKCKNLRKVFSSNMLSRLGSLRELEIRKCEMLDEVFEIQGSDIEEPSQVTKTQLKALDLWELPRLKGLFPPSFAKGLIQLERLNIEDCGIQEIVTKEKGQVDTMPKFVFPRLTHVVFGRLPELVSFYPGLHISEWPSLKALEVSECPKLKVIVLKVDGKHEMVNQNVQSLNSIEKVHTIEEGCSIIAPLLEELDLVELPTVTHLWENNSHGHKVKTFEYLVGLQVMGCGRLKNLAPSSMSFQRLKTLRVSRCCEMINLFTSSTAKCLTQLEMMSIANCQRMTEIISNEGGSDAEAEIIFSKLSVLVLHNLPSLTSFHSGNCNIRFPNLERLIVSNCLEMQSFSRGAVTPMLQRVETWIDDEEVWNERHKNFYITDIAKAKPIDELWKGDVNTTIEEIWNRYTDLKFQVWSSVVESLENELETK